MSWRVDWYKADRNKPLNITHHTDEVYGEWDEIEINGKCICNNNGTEFWLNLKSSNDDFKKEIKCLHEDEDCDCCDCDDDCCDCDDEVYEIECPACNDVIYLDAEMLEEEGMVCPNCGTDLEFDFDFDCDCGCDCCGEDETEE